MRILFLSLLITVCRFYADAQTTSDSTKTDIPVYVLVDVMPQFPGGEQAFQKFISSHIKYPADAKAQGVQGVVYAIYVIKEDGTLTDVKIVTGKGLSPSCDQAVIDVLKKSPKWSPGLKNGKPVSVRMIQKVKFTLENSAPNNQN